MKKLLASVLAASTVLSLSAAAFAAGADYIKVDETKIVDSDGESLDAEKGATTTFDVESGDQMEFSVYGEEYGMLAEGDEGKLTFQGSRYLGFERAIEN